MLTNLRDRLPDVEEVGETAAEWAKDGFQSARDAVKSGPLMWGAATLGFGALVGGLFALWRRGGAKLRNASARKTVAVRTRAKQALRRVSDTHVINSAATKKNPNCRGARARLRMLEHHSAVVV